MSLTNGLTAGLTEGLATDLSSINYIDPSTLSDLITYIDESSSMTITNGDEISAITATTGLNWAEVDAGDHATWKPDQFNGVGGIELRDLTQMLYTGFSTSSIHTFIVAFEHPSTIGSGDIMFFANSGGGTDNQAKITFTGGKFYYSNNQGATASAISDTQLGGDIVYGVFEFKSTTDLTVRFYSEEGNLLSTYTIDPVDDYTGWNSILVGARTAGAEDGGYAGLRINSWVHRSTIISQSDVIGVIKFLARKFSVNPTYSYISTQTDITAASPYSIDVSSDSNWNEDEGAFIVRYDAPTTAVDYTYLAVASDGSSSANTTGFREDGDADLRGYVRVASSNFNTTSNDDTIIRDTTAVGIFKFSNTGSSLLSGQELSATAHGALADGLTTINVGSRNAGAEAADLTVRDFTVVRGDKNLKYINSQAYNSSDFVVAGGGQSLLVGHFVAQSGTGFNGGEIEFRTTIGDTATGKACVFIEGATGSTAAAKTSNPSAYWWDNATDTRGTAFDTFYNAIDTLGYTPNYVLWSQGEEDSHQIDVLTTKAEYKQALLSIFTDMRATYGNLEIYIQAIGRRTSFTNTGGIQAVREAQQELASEYSWIHIASHSYDVGLFDAVHLDDAGYVTVAERSANKMLVDKEYGVTGSAVGMSITSAVRSGTSVTVTLSHDAGTDFTPTSGIEGFVFHDDGSAITVNSAVRTDANTITLTLASEPSGVEELYYGFDAMLGINTANIVKDNSATTLPLIPTKVIL
jgi:hypothetical protein